MVNQFYEKLKGDGKDAERICKHGRGQGEIFVNNEELKHKVHSIVSSILKEKNYISPVDLLMKIGVLSAKDYEDWRFGRVPYLEKVCKTNLSKLSFIMKELRAYALANHLKPSWTAYKQWGVKGTKIPLRFCKSGDSRILHIMLPIPRKGKEV